MGTGKNGSDDPFAPPPDHTEMPRPGSGRDARAPLPGEPVAARPPPAPESRSAQAPPRAPPAPPPALPMALDDFLTTGVNSLVLAATPLLVLAGRLRGQIAAANVDSLRRQALAEVRAFEQRARRANVPQEDVLAARYALCTVVDEAVMNTPWGHRSSWSTQSLLSTLHHEVFGGAKFFDILDRISPQGQRFLALMELQYVCIALGFEGKYRLEPQGAEQLGRVRADLYQRIQSMRGRSEKELSPHWQGEQDRRNAIVRFVPLWIVAAFCCALLVAGYVYLRSSLGVESEPVNARLAGIGLNLPAPALPALPPREAPVTAARNRLRQALEGAMGRGAIPRGSLLIDELPGNKTRVTLTRNDLFESGSARVNSAYATLLQQFAVALESAPGQVQVVGHTDNRPIRSFEFADNFELSRVRARNVASIIQQSVSNAARIESSGVGSSDPRYKPEDDPRNQAANRRVEIFYVPDR